MLEWIKKNRKELLLPSLCFVLGLLLSISTIQVQEQDTDIKEDRTLTSFQPKNYQNLVTGEQEAKRFQWTKKAGIGDFEGSFETEPTSGDTLGNGCD